MKRLIALAIVAALCASGAAQAAVVATTQHAHNGGLGAPGPLIGSIISGDMLESAAGTDSPVATTWHGANPNAAERFPSLTDGTGPVSGVTGLLNDFQGPTIGLNANDVNYFTYSFGGPKGVSDIIVTGGNFGGDGRIFLTFLAEYSTDNGANWTGFGPNNGYFQSDPSGSINVIGNAQNISGDQFDPYEETQVAITRDDRPFLAAGVTDLRFLFWNVDNTQGQNRDPYPGVNPFTGFDDGFTQPVTGSLVWEIDVLPEPASLALLGMGAVAVLRRRR